MGRMDDKHSGGPTKPSLAGDERPTVGPESLDPDDDPGALDPSSRADRYEPGALLGMGGMGEVRTCSDRIIGRRVAMKTMRKDALQGPEARARFFREARVQGQTEHPCIVPVYDVGTDEAGAPYFTMRCVEGKTLEEILRGLRRQNEPLSREFSLRKLLTAFGSACLAVHFAHTRGFFHCDIKPANIMLGSFGELYVLDWGLASRAPRSMPVATRAERGRDEEPVASGRPGLGTPGYASPEQVRGEAPGARWDVYALGAVLYEILTLEPMHSGASPSDRFDATLRGQVERPSRRSPARDVAPELEAIWSRATTVDASLRYESARDLYDDLERYLEGDRDLTRRRELSREHAARAASLAERALRESTEEPGARSAALGAVGRALALDPDNAEALRTLVQLLTEPPAEMPAEALEDMHASERALDRARSRSGLIGLLLWGVVAPFAFLRNGVRSVPAFALVVVVGLAAAALGALRMRRPKHDGFAPTYIPVAVAIAVGTLGVCFHPLILTPTIAMPFAVGYTLSMDRRRRFLPMIVTCAALALPSILEWLRVVPPSSVVEGDLWCMVPRMTMLPGPASMMPFVTDIVCLAAACLYAVRFREVLTEMERRAAVGAWQHRQLVPGGARLAARPQT
jgi:serine/threonine protein kinase